jgi:hypothetical protein
MVGRITPTLIPGQGAMKVRSLAALLAGLLICGDAGAHSVYSKQCCDDRDCFPVDRISKRREGGYDLIVKGKYIKVPGSFVDLQRVAAVGFSQGGWVSLLVAEAKFVRTVGPSKKFWFRAAVAF